MNTDLNYPIRRIPTLVGLCQRVCASNIGYISSFGDDLRYDLVKPILERCNAEQLLRLEASSPHLQASTPEIWKSLCYSVHTLARYSEDEPESWRDHYFFLNAAEEKRLEEASAKLRSQRHEAEERKKEREVKLTDRVPPPKRQRTGWGAPTPKTLFQKTRTEASKMQKTMSQRMLPPMPQNGKRYSVLPKSASAAIDFLPPSSSSSRVTVNNVVHRRPVTSSAASSASIASTPASASSSMPSTIKARPLIAPSKSSPGVMGVSSKPPLRSDAPAPAESRPPKPPAKKDPMASLFVPKRRPNPQRP